VGETHALRAAPLTSISFMSFKRNLPVPLRYSRNVLRRGLPAFVQPYLLLIFGSAILLSFVVVGSGDATDPGETVEITHSRDAIVDGPPVGFNKPEQAPSLAPAQKPQQSASSQNAPTATPTFTRIPTATATATTFPTPTPQPTPAIAPLRTTTNVLILGSDQRPDEPNWRTDVIMLLMMNPDLGEAAIISFPRDMYIDYIPGHAPNRINVIDYLGELDEPGGGGPRLLRSVLEERLGIVIDHHVRFRFEGFEDVIDALGGLRIYVDCYLYEYYPEEGIYLNLPPGEHLLSGQQALSYVRSRRSGGGDLERARRQQRVVWALRKQLVEEEFLTHLLRLRQLYETYRYTVDTDVGLWDALKYARFGLSLNERSVKGMVLGAPALTPGWRQEMAVFLVDWIYVATELRQVFDRPPLIDTNTAISPNHPQPDDGVGGAAGAVSRTECQ
jgi:LCP family protein required for cell wall assembly